MVILAWKENIKDLVLGGVTNRRQDYKKVRYKPIY